MVKKQKLFLLSLLSLIFLVTLYVTFSPMMSSVVAFLEADACLDAGGSLKNAKGICLIQAPDGFRVSPWKPGALLSLGIALVSCFPALLGTGVVAGIVLLIRGK